MTRRATPADYARLGVSLRATPDEIKSAYRKQALRFHPDRNVGDPDAPRRFQEATESYAAITQGGPPLPARPLSTAAARPPAATPVGRPVVAPHPVRPRTPVFALPGPIASLAGGDVAWVALSAILVAPDRSCFLDPAATGEPYGSPRTPVRVEHRGDGFHVQLPDQRRHRWSISPRASSSGLRLASLGIGGADQRASGRNPLLPSSMLDSTVATMAEGQRGWTVASALVVEPDGRCWIDGGEMLNGEPTMTTPVRVERHAEGIYITAEGRPEAWARRELQRSPQHIPVLGAVLGGVALHAPRRTHA